MERGQDRLLSWLPLYHDMGLIGFFLLPLYLGCDLLCIDTHTFLQRPAIWVEQATTWRATFTGGPTFATGIAAKTLRTVGSAADLSGVRVWAVGAELVVADVCRRFSSVATEHGLSEEAIFPVYGMAEAVLLCSAPPPGRPLKVWAPPGPHAEEVVLLGPPLEELEVRIASPKSKGVSGELPSGQLELRGPHIVADVGETGWYSSGDVGGLLDGEVFVVGRATDVIQIGGRSISPEELEEAVRSLPDVRAGGVAAFAVRLPVGTEAVVVIVERRKPSTDHRALALEARNAVRQRCGLVVRDVVVMEPGTLEKTSSGKLRRATYRDQYLNGTLARVGSG
jgi:fatty-acyl-CoA synthase